ncbi:MAG: MotA/TolQ/ExbB proton channel family protein [Gammaproteobacteria bacterium]|nr:MotA/TolQ/ExbB proton channel family protein [Gammaproteobacteria bacterium]NIR81613.1 MotA/TolQ/ExbB proton channel family protein [Gammaproteobacteria bacterium]NIR88164.1 MotA/TolQ/ExbB proton channel family protein [Gammaproteobacteria bacterium]NIU02725.1 MotA/TolQ/ExbB proton channel family protein [Gammaproteobacteria bacterium]NIV73324.1 MotA/TolQ/ExbB proton channel family protein [Gammaproteobacteria bacterium]
MRKAFPTEFVYQLFALIVAAIIVHAIYVAVIRPNADAFLHEQQARIQADPDYQPERSLSVLVRDYEQEACFILMLWAFAIMAYKGVATYRERRLLDDDLLGIEDLQRIRAEDAHQLSRDLQSLPRRLQGHLLPRALLSGLHRFSATRSVQDVSTATREVCETEAERLESELSIVRYIAWAIPSIGFIGTVRGIGDALAQAHQAVEGNITGVTQSLGVAFNSTFIALVISIVVMFFVHQLQLQQERLVLETESYCDDHLVRHLAD